MLPRPSGSRTVRGAQGACVARAARPRGEAARALTWCARRAGTGPRAAGPRRGPGPGSCVAAAAMAPARKGPCPRTRLPPSGSRAAAADSPGSLSGRRHYCFPRRLSAALPRSGRQRRACSRRCQECHRGPPRLSLKVLALPSPGPAQPSPHPRAPPRSATASGQAASGKRRPGS